MNEEKKFVEMNEHELKTITAELREKMRKSEMMGILNEYEVYKRRALIAESYLVDTSKIEIGKVYSLVGETPSYFKVERIKGVFAWGFRLKGSKIEEGIPVSLLQL
ncbi:YfhH family protein [Mammaliicoccus sp. Dog046]|uniref:YfhH family protein n=1 Tax=Mammaliicoccus sp. Dog046 TaxID=3034233 RepID=UPI002B25CB83|nr:YfhH family protein [Mammaliicoccus sp. Dog046]WQK86281.1 YfhH family protein [Mammaliicoccus sp. Dog046]